jgi:hypothetical protein
MVNDRSGIKLQIVNAIHKAVNEALRAKGKE